MDKLHTKDDKAAFCNEQQVSQLIRIARLESDKPLGDCKALVFGSSEQAKLLFETLKKRCTGVKLAGSVAELQEKEQQFELVVILEPISHRVLENLMAPHGVAIDANLQRSGEWVMYDKSLNFKRIRVLSMIGR